MGLDNMVYLNQLTLWINNNQFTNKYMEMFAECFSKLDLLNYLSINISY